MRASGCGLLQVNTVPRTRLIYSCTSCCFEDCSWRGSLAQNNIFAEANDTCE